MEPFKKTEFFMCVAGAACALCLFLPSVVYVLNLDSVTTPKTTIMLCGGIMALLLSSLLLLLALVPALSRWIGLCCKIALFVVVVLTAFPNHTGEITGFTSTLKSSLPVWATTKILAVSLAGGWLAWQRPKTLVWLTRCFLIVILVVTCGVAIGPLSTSDKAARKLGEKPKESFSRLGSGANVIVVVLDSFTGYRMAEVMQEHPELRKDLDGFVYYPLALASAVNTPAGVGVILTGDLKTSIEIDSVMSRNGAALNSSFLADALKNDLNVGIITSLRKENTDIPWSYEQKFFEQKEIRWVHRLPSYLGFLAAALPRIAPDQLGAVVNFCAKRVSIHNRNSARTEWDLLQSLQSVAERRPLASKLALGYFIDNLHVIPGKGSVIVLHSYVSHAPNILTASGSYETDLVDGYDGTSIFAARELSRLCNKLKELGVYNDALVIAVSDHGGLGVKDVTFGGRFPAKKALPLEYNPLVMVKAPRSRGPCRDSSMSVWLGDVSATIRDFLHVPAPQGVFLTQSLLKQEIPNRRLNIPVFFHPDQEGYHTALSKWIRKDFVGTFQEYGSIFNIEPEKMLETKARVLLFSGADRLAKEVQEKTAVKQAGVHRAIIEVNRMPLAKLTTPGIVVVTGNNDGYKKQIFSDLDAAEAFLRAVPSDRDCLAVGLGVPVERARRIFGAAFISSDMKSPVGFVSVSGPSYGSTPRTVVGSEDVSLEIDWKHR